MESHTFRFQPSGFPLTTVFEVLPDSTFELVIPSLAVKPFSIVLMHLTWPTLAHGVEELVNLAFVAPSLPSMELPLAHVSQLNFAPSWCCECIRLSTSGPQLVVGGRWALSSGLRNMIASRPLYNGRKSFSATT